MIRTITAAFVAAFLCLPASAQTPVVTPLKRSSAALQVRLADDSAFALIQGKHQTDTAYTAGVTTATGYLVLYDSTGTAYKVNACTGC